MTGRGSKAVGLLALLLLVGLAGPVATLPPAPEDQALETPVSPEQPPEDEATKVEADDAFGALPRLPGGERPPLAPEDRRPTDAYVELAVPCGAVPHYPNEAAMRAAMIPLPPGVGASDPDYVVTFAGSPSTSSPSSVRYTSTNVQVDGVDEMDSVKTDGTYIYLIDGEFVRIVLAYPPSEARVTASIEFAEAPMGLFLAGDRLVVLTRDPAVKGSNVWVAVYDILDRSAPRPVRELNLEGRFAAARRVGDWIYVASATSLVTTVGGVRYPSVRADGRPVPLGFSDVVDVGGDNLTSQVIVFASLDITGSRASAVAIVPSGSGGVSYMSLRSFYLTVPVWTLASSETWWGWRWWGMADSTGIVRLHTSVGKVCYGGRGEVTGMVPDQFAMDEFDDHFRVVTEYAWRGGAELHVLDDAMVEVSNLTGIGANEDLKSVRFLGERAFVVTFKKIDPLFALDLSDPLNPRVLGELKIPGFSEYLHPYGEDRLIGLGYDTHDLGDFAWFQGIKLSLFDISVMTDPRETAAWFLGDRGTWSPALYDHHAFTFDEERGLLILPVAVFEVADPAAPPNSYGDFSWQGAQVVGVTRDGLVDLGHVSHGACDSAHPGSPWGYPEMSSCMVSRALLIGDYLYTVSGDLLRVSSVDSLARVLDLVL